MPRPIHHDGLLDEPGDGGAAAAGERRAQHPRQQQQGDGQRTDENVAQPVRADHDARDDGAGHQDQAGDAGDAVAEAEHEAGEDHRHDAVIAREAVARLVLGGEVHEARDQAGVGKDHRRAGVGVGHQVADEFVDQRGGHQHGEADAQPAPPAALAVALAGPGHDRQHGEHDQGVVLAVVEGGEHRVPVWIAGVDGVVEEPEDAIVEMGP